MRNADVLLALAAAAVLAVLAFRTAGAPALSPYRASWELTPGALNPDVTQSTIGETICTSGWTRTVRPPTDYTNDLKLKQMSDYGRTGGLADYQEDHLISLELGGDPTDPRNLWPEPYPRASEMDQIENELNSEICDGKLTLAEAQQREDTIKHTQG
ncbi:MAG TPA: hypothetical protein VGH26_05040 [Gaiellaceae bacterium]